MLREPAGGGVVDTVSGVYYADLKLHDVAHAVKMHAEAKEQEKLYEVRKAFTARLLRQQLGEVGKYQVGDRVISIRSGRTTHTVDAKGFAKRLEQLELTDDVLFRILAAATGFDTDELPQWVIDESGQYPMSAADILEEFTDYKTGQNMVYNDPVRMLAIVPEQRDDMVERDD